jgi:hypothetical protein
MLVWLLWLLLVLEPEWRPADPAPAAIVASFLLPNMHKGSWPSRVRMAEVAGETPRVAGMCQMSGGAAAWRRHGQRVQRRGPGAVGAHGRQPRLALAGHQLGTGAAAGAARGGWACCVRAPTDLMSVTRRLWLSRCALHAFTSSRISCDVCRQLLYLRAGDRRVYRSPADARHVAVPWLIAPTSTFLH